MTNRILAQITFEISQIDHLLESYSDLLEQAQMETPDLVETTAIASVLHSFYNGVENIFLLIAKNVDSAVPSSSKWHRDLLIQMTQPAPGRQPIITAETADRLAEYMGFRHFYRHSYSFTLDWAEMQELAASLGCVWDATKNEIRGFLTSLTADDDELTQQGIE